MGHSDYIPKSDAKFDPWQANLLALVSLNITLWGILAADFAIVQDLQTLWAAAWKKASAKQNRTSGDVKQKNDTRKDYEKALRIFVKQWLAYNTRVTDADRELLGITVRSTERHRIPAPTEMPTGTIDFSKRLQQTVTVLNVGATKSTTKAENAHAFELFMKKGGAAPIDPSELAYVATETSSSYTVHFTGEDAGKIIYYCVRWVNSRGEAGPWSIVFSALVVG